MGQLFRSRDTKGLEPTVQGMLDSQGGGGGGLPAGVSPAVSGGSAGGAGGGLPAGVSPAVSGGSAGGARWWVAGGGESGGVGWFGGWCRWWVAGRGESGGVGWIGRFGWFGWFGWWWRGAGRGWFDDVRPCGETSRLHDYDTRPQPPRCTAAGRTSSDCTCRAAWFAAPSADGLCWWASACGAATWFAAPGADGLCWWASACGAAAWFAGPGADGLRQWHRADPACLFRACARGTAASPTSMFSPAFSGFGGGPPSGSPGMPFGGAAFQGAAPPSFGPGEWMHHADAGLGPAGAGAVPPAAPIAPHVAPTPVSPHDCAHRWLRGLAFAGPRGATICAPSAVDRPTVLRPRRR